MAHDIFISYAAEDKPVADAVCARLEGQGSRCWIAPRDILPGMDWSEAIIEAIGKSHIMVLVFSESANQSQQVMREVERAVSKGIPILPFRIEDVPLSPSMEYFISAPHWLDAITGPLEAHLDRLAATAKVILAQGEPDAGKSVTAPRLPPPGVSSPPHPPPARSNPAPLAAGIVLPLLLYVRPSWRWAAVAPVLVLLGGFLLRVVLVFSSEAV